MGDSCCGCGYNNRARSGDGLVVVVSLRGETVTEQVWPRQRGQEVGRQVRQPGTHIHYVYVKITQQQQQGRGRRITAASKTAGTPQAARVTDNLYFFLGPGQKPPEG